MTSGPIQQLASALDVTGEVLTSIAEDQWTLPTPCTEWTVRELASHLVTGNEHFTSALAGQKPATPDNAEGDLSEAYRRSARELLDAFGQPGALDRNVDVPLGTVPGVAALHLKITKLLVHGWDLARATGQAASFPDALAEQELAFSRAKLGDIPAGRRPFEPPQPVADDAPAMDRLAACLGRRVTACAEDGA
ncbi:MAG: TIGR03086 family metal-binding protein [Acidimicrobiales bacterium]